MATYRAIASSETDPQAPITSALMKALDANATAIAEGASGAPPIRQANILSGAAAVTQTFTGLDDYSGVEFELHLQSTVAASISWTISYSTNGGSSWSTPENYHSNGGATGNWRASGAFDFATGTLVMIIHNLTGGAGIRVSQTVAGASASINAVRFASGGTITTLALIRPKGATV